MNIKNIENRIEQRKMDVRDRLASEGEYCNEENALYLTEKIYDDCLKIIKEEFKGENNGMKKSVTKEGLKEYANAVSDYCKSLDKSDIPRIRDVNIIVPNKVVEVTFSDRTKEKAVCHEEDTFSLEAAIAICISKKIMGGSSAYNNAVKRGVKVYEDKLKREELDRAEQERIEKRRAKRLAYKKRRDEKKAQIEKERQIEIQKEAYIRAMEYMNNSEYTQAR